MIYIHSGFSTSIRSAMKLLGANPKDMGYMGQVIGLRVGSFIMYRMPTHLST